MTAINRKHGFPIPLFPRKMLAIYGVLLIYTLIVWGWAFYALYGHPFLFSTAVLAYLFGLRHAVDADHIAAIDNVTRQLMQQGKSAVATGLYFSLGHASVVFFATIGIALTTATVIPNNLIHLQAITSVVCATISAVFLLLIAVVNARTLLSTYRIVEQIRHSKFLPEDDRRGVIEPHGVLGRQVKKIFRLITHSWQMYPLGFVLGLGFDTASEIALLGIAASETIQGLSLSSVLIFPALFTAGMTLVDTTACLLMLGAYGWAFLKPIRKLYYNMVITSLSILVAIGVGGVEVLGLIANTRQADGVLWQWVRTINSHFSTLGYMIVFFFMACWLISAIIYQLKPLHSLDNA
jgi:high-affinity nickel-transport protein